jgi:hypothetical protein
MVTSKRMNLVREHQLEYAGSPTPRLIHLSPATYLAVEGNETRDRSAALGALLAIARRIRKSKRHAGHDFVPAPLEDLVWPGLPPGKTERWTLLSRVPSSVQARDVLRARRELAHHHEAEHVELRNLPEGDCVQVSMGPDGADGLIRFASETGLELTGPLHRIFGREVVLRCRISGSVAAPIHRRVRRRARGIPASWRRWVQGP